MFRVLRIRAAGLYQFMGPQLKAVTGNPQVLNSLTVVCLIHCLRDWCFLSFTFLPWLRSHVGPVPHVQTTLGTRRCHACGNLAPGP